MSTTPSSDRRFIVALTTAVASTTLAVGVTAGVLLGWVGPRTASGEPSSPAPAGAGSAQVVYVPITPSAPALPTPVEPATAGEPRIALADPDSRPDDRREHEHEHEEHDDD
jgi:hypothetical protein